MAENATTLNVFDLEREFSWFARVLDTRLKLYFGQEAEFSDIESIPPLDLADSDSPYASAIKKFSFGSQERLALILALIPHIRPQAIDVLFNKNSLYDRGFTEFGGLLGKRHGGFIPTGETLAFLLAGTDLKKRFQVLSLFDQKHPFASHHILSIDTSEEQEPFLSGSLDLSPEYISLFTTGETHRPRFSAQFPARFIETRLDWQDLVLHPGTLATVREIESWIKHGDTLLNDWQMAGKIRPGYRALFYGPPGTGKTMTACLLGKSTGRDVYMVDLSTVVSKYIGETEKNLSRIFDMAENKDWILFFDEADALFGKRTETKDAHDRYANQEVSYLLQRIEAFKGISILASNMKGNLDKAFIRRFESVIYFPMPAPKERLQLWKKGFSPKAILGDDIQLEQIANAHELSGGSIMNVIRFASLQAIEKGDNTITMSSINQGIQREFAKEGRIS